MDILVPLFLPFIGTALGALFVFFLKDSLPEKVEKSLLGFAAGVMVAASVWSLLIPSMNYCEDMGKLAFLPATIGFLIGMFFLLLLDEKIPHLHGEEIEGTPSKMSRTYMMVMAIILHNLPEGMAVGVVLAGIVNGSDAITIASATALSLGIAIQNLPEGAIVSLPLAAGGEKKGKAFLYGILSGAVEPLGAILMILLFRIASPLLPYLLGFAAGAMIYVVIEDIVPDIAKGRHSNAGTVFFALGFALMMILDVTLG